MRAGARMAAERVSANKKAPGCVPRPALDPFRRALRPTYFLKLSVVSFRVCAGKLKQGEAVPGGMRQVV